jgi:hypothetical protein
LIIDRLSTNKQSDAGLAYYYCQYHREEIKSPASIIRSIIAQLVSTILNGDGTLRILDELYRKKSQGQGPPGGIRLLGKLFTDIATLYLKVIIVIDGLDECTMGAQEQILEFIKLAQNFGNTSVLVLSRPEEDIKEELNSFPTVSLQKEEVNLREDMKRFIEEEFQNTRRWGMGYSFPKYAF